MARPAAAILGRQSWKRDRAGDAGCDRCGRHVHRSRRVRRRPRRGRGLRTEKAHTTPPDFERGIFDALRKAGVAPAAVAFFAHGCTVVINALTERRGVRTGLITTRGFRDVLEIARGNRPDFFNFMVRKPEPFVPRHLRAEIDERLDHRGAVLRPLDLDGLPAVLDGFHAEGVEAVAVCLLHAYVNPALMLNGRRRSSRPSRARGRRRRADECRPRYGARLDAALAAWTGLVSPPSPSA